MGKSHVFDARSQMPVSASELFTWHTREGAFERLSPPWEHVEVVERTGDGIRTGARVVVRMSLGPIPQRMVAEHTLYEEGSLFQDTQRSGPFAKWVHTHRMLPGPDSRTSTLHDEIEYVLPVGALGSAFGNGIARTKLERMFAYRHRVTREDLRRHAAFASHGPLTVAITGASGLVGSSLTPFLTTGGHTVKRMVRGKADPSKGEVSWAPDKGQVDTDALEGVDAVVHLAGANVAGQRWTPEYKNVILKSRSEGTRTLCEALARMKRKPRVLVCATATGIYGSRGDEPLTEESAPGGGFLADVCRAWEAATAPAEAAGIRVVRLRIGPVLDAREGPLAKLLPAFKAGGGGPIGSGQQWFSWVSLEDVLGLIHFSLFTEAARGPINTVAPGTVRQEEFARTLGRVIRRPAFLPVPAPVIRTLFGEMGQETVLSGARVLPTAAERLGYTFIHRDLEDALRFTLGRTTAGPEYRGS
ncbi:TIGR01777 family protein [Pyxidicoccus fallax]|uniref:TIGR01777 family protein n=1 Tax=Pyxidicoccus fallax TaxID=394095 RepID=A0A848M0J3_9BACT|nr:TIGR01777 family oxidoreductase [Pyxidicoccus fallax]NMO22904.1 TIGR01777 family protein [Pyxidicoccus fallax]NPC85725.1 TIGR01777 family protein [Pyxidicoccus fallax]